MQAFISFFFPCARVKRGHGHRRSKRRPWLVLGIRMATFHSAMLYEESLRKIDAKDLEPFWKGSVHEFNLLKALMTLEQVNSSKKRSMVIESINWSGVFKLSLYPNWSSDEHAVYLRRLLK